MKLRSGLRLKKEEKCGLELLKNHHPESEIREVELEGRYLRIFLYDENDLHNEALLNVDTWLQETDNKLPGIPWRQVPLNYLMRWLKGMQLSFILKSRVWNVGRIELPPTVLPKKMLCLPAQPCSLLCLEWSAGDNPILNALHLKKYRIPFIVDVVLGYSQLPVSQFIDVAKGDLLLIQHQSGYLKIGTKKLFLLNIDNNIEVVVQEKFTDIEDSYRNEEETLLRWSELPVEIEFVLDSRYFTLAELDVIYPGMTLSLNQNAEQRVKIYLNRKLFARGELVALENGNLAVEINQVNTFPSDAKDISDVE
ncbi:FliM/FliN family flagellar motor switch protein [Erwinia piriflorinigrans]|uniref:Surface presentation of antigens protein SpaO n=1 Tax=Erwinia piriflorinigrans CFBP 5888 TaxID=1161919 RepID=V5Z7R2_9GAMM|nr:FliM/FliN family flagellar motor switch protein [Erwinia piriflorinigrans]CCG87070.1 Surface presentation of antigens protein SpaO [Erwinia piriflorinigrans CFBP 5888]